MGAELTYMFQQAGIAVWVDDAIRKSNRFYKAAGALIGSYDAKMGVHLYSTRKLHHEVDRKNSCFVVNAAASASYPLADDHPLVFAASHNL